MLFRTQKSTNNYTYTPYAKKQGVFTDNYDVTTSKNNTAQLLPSLNKKTNEWQQSNFDYKENDSFKNPLKKLLNTDTSNSNVYVIKKPKLAGFTTNTNPRPGSLIKNNITKVLSKKYGELDTKHIFDDIDDSDVENNISTAENTIKTNIDKGFLSKNAYSIYPNLRDGLALSYAAADKGKSKAATRAREAAYTESDLKAPKIDAFKTTNLPYTPNQEHKPVNSVIKNLMDNQLQLRHDLGKPSTNAKNLTNIDLDTNYTKNNNFVPVKFSNKKNDQEGKKEKKDNSFWDVASAALAAASFIPGADTVTNLLSIPVDLIKGDYVSAGLDALGVIPFIGEVADAAKVARKADDIADIVNVAKKANNTKNVVDAAKKTYNMAETVNVGDKVHDLANVVENISPYKIEPTHSLTLSKTKYTELVDDIKKNGITETIKYVEHNGTKYVVDGHHRLQVAKDLKLKDVPVEKVSLPYKGYKDISDLEWYN